MASDAGRQCHHSRKSPVSTSQTPYLSIQNAESEKSSTAPGVADQHSAAPPTKYRIIRSADNNMQPLMCQDLPGGRVQYVSYSTHIASGLPADSSSRTIHPTFVASSVGDEHHRFSARKLQTKAPYRQQRREEYPTISSVPNPTQLAESITSHSLRVNLVGPGQMTSAPSERTSVDVSRPTEDSRLNCVDVHPVVNSPELTGSPASPLSSQPIVVDGRVSSRRPVVPLNGGALPHPLQYAIIITDPQLQHSGSTNAIGSGSSNNNTISKEGDHNVLSNNANHIVLSRLFQQQPEIPTPDKNSAHNNNTDSVTNKYQVFQTQRPHIQATFTSSLPSSSSGLTLVNGLGQKALAKTLISASPIIAPETSINRNHNVGETNHSDHPKVKVTVPETTGLKVKGLNPIQPGDASSKEPNFRLQLSNLALPTVPSGYALTNASSLKLSNSSQISNNLLQEAASAPAAAAATPTTTATAAAVEGNIIIVNYAGHLIDSSTPTAVVVADPDKALNSSLLGDLQLCHVVNTGDRAGPNSTGHRTTTDHAIDKGLSANVNNNNNVVDGKSIIINNNNNVNNSNSSNYASLVSASVLPDESGGVALAGSTLRTSAPTSTLLLRSDSLKATASAETVGGGPCPHNGVVSVIGLVADGERSEPAPDRITSNDLTAVNSNHILVSLGGGLRESAKAENSLLHVSSSSSPLGLNNRKLADTLSKSNAVRPLEPGASEEELSIESVSEGMHSGRSGSASGQGYSSQQQQQQLQQQQQNRSLTGSISISSSSASNANSSSSNENSSTTSLSASTSSRQSAMLSAGQPTLPAGLFRTGAENSPSSHRLSAVGGAAGYNLPTQYPTIYGGVPNQASVGHVPTLQPYSLFPQFAASGGTVAASTGPVTAPPHGFSHPPLIGASPGRQYHHVESYSAILASMGSHALRGSPSSERSRAQASGSAGLQRPTTFIAPVHIPASASQFPSIPPSQALTSGPSASPSSSLSSTPSSHHRLSGSSSPSPGLASAHAAGRASMDQPSPSSILIDKMAEMKAAGAEGHGRDLRIYGPAGEGSILLEGGKASHSPGGSSSAPYSSLGHVPKVSFDNVVREYGGGRDSPTGRGGSGEYRDPSGSYRATLSGKEGSLKHRILTRPSDSDMPEDLAKVGGSGGHSLKDEPAVKRAKFAGVASSGSAVPYGSPVEYDEERQGRHHSSSAHPHPTNGNNVNNNNNNNNNNNHNNNGSRSTKGGGSERSQSLSYAHSGNNGNSNHKGNSSGSSSSNNNNNHHHPGNQLSQHHHQSSLSLSSTSPSSSSYSMSSSYSQHQQQHHSSGNGAGNGTSTSDTNTPSSSSGSGNQYSKPHRHSSSSSPPGPPPPPPPPPTGSSNEDGSPSSSSHLQYPHHFMRGSIIQLANGTLKRVEDLQTEDFVSSAEISADLKVDSSTVVRIEEQPDRGTAMLSFSVGEHRVQVTVEATLEHPFFVFGQGWSSCSVSRTLARYGLDCQKLSVGDVCISLTHKDVNLRAAEISQHQQHHEQAASETASTDNRSHDPLPPPAPPSVSQRSTVSSPLVSPSTYTSSSPMTSPQALSSSSLPYPPSSSCTLTSAKTESRTDASSSSLSSTPVKRRLSQSELPPPSSTVVPIKKEWHHQQSRRRGSQNGEDEVKEEQLRALKKEELEENVESESTSALRKRHWSAPDPSILKADQERDRERQKRANEAQKREEQNSPGNLDSK